MVINYLGSDWIIKLGPITRTNHAASKLQAESGSCQMVLDDAKEILEKAKVLVPLLQKGSVCVGGNCEPKVEEEGADPQVVSYELSDGKFFAIAESKVFGFKLVCEKPKNE